ncbi:MAG: hypothetical protein WAM60_22090, partial [Candidatus Promineifilaceae bacterium]
LDKSGIPLYEDYGPHHGFVVSPYPSFVQNRLGQLMQDITQSIPSDLVYEDQIGGRASHPDYNPDSPDPAAYAQGWLEHTRQFQNLILTSEMGYDRLAETETGFHGSVLLAEAEGKTTIWWGDGNWYLYPMAPIALRDKVLLYHNTENRSATAERRVLAMNLGFGYMLSFDWTASGSNGDWLAPVGVFQSRVLSEYAGERILDYSNLTSHVTQTKFERVMATTNWNTTSSYSLGQYTLPPLGTMVASDDDSLIAGIFTKYNGVSLTGGAHYLVEERESERIMIRQPRGADTVLTIDLLPQWNMDTPLEIWVYDNTGFVIGTVPGNVTSNCITFNYQQKIGGKTAAYYSISNLDSIFIPLMIDS